MSTPGYRSFSPALQRFLLATVVNTVGSAALFSFMLVYFHEIRGLSLSRAGLVVGVQSFAMVVFTPVGGALTDRFGGRRILVAGCALSIAVACLFGFVDSFAEAVGVTALLGAANALWFPAQAALLAVIVEPHERPAVSAFQRAAMNLGAALGGVVGGLMVRSETLGAFRAMFVMNVATYVVFLAVLPGLPSGRVGPAGRVGGGPGYGEVLRDRFFVKLLGTDIAIAVGFGFLWAFMPIYASALGIGKGTVGALFGLGATSVVFTQIPTLRWVRGGHRMSWLVVMNLWFVAAFSIMPFTSHVPVGLAIVGIGMAQVLGGFGEAVLGAVRTPLTSDLAPLELMGRYHGLATMVFQVCMGLANTIGGVVMDQSLSAVWFIPLIISLAGVAGTAALRRQIPAHLAISA